MRLFVCALFAVVVAGVAGRAQAPAPPAGKNPQAGQARQGDPGGGGGPFAGQTPVNALIVSGGCCHDYALQNKTVMDLLNAVMPIHRTTVMGMTNNIPEGKLPFYQNPTYAKGALNKEPIAIPAVAPARRGGKLGRGAAPSGPAAAPEAR